MATKKPIKKTTAKTKTPARAKAKAPVKKTSSTSVKRPVKRANTRTSVDSREFMSVQPNRETLYWLVLGVVVVTFGVWINALQTDIQKIYDQIEVSAANEPTLVVPKETPAAQ